MNVLLCQIGIAAVWLVNLYSIVLFVYALISWVPDLRGRWVDYLAMLVEPVLLPIRRIIPPLGGLDLAFLVLILVLQFLVRPLLANVAGHACSPY